VENSIVVETGTGSSVRGRGIYELSSFPFDEGAVLVVGDLRRGYRVVDRLGATFEIVQTVWDAGTQRPLGARGLLAHRRVGADVIADGKALRLLSLEPQGS
jgi:HK97 family phage major capsid protein